MLVFGAGEGGAGVIKALLRDPDSPAIPVAILDDDPGQGAPVAHGHQGGGRPKGPGRGGATVPGHRAAHRHPQRRSRPGPGDLGPRPCAARSPAAEAGADVDVDVEIEYIGLRAGEKLHEVLWGSGEDDWRPKHSMVSHVQVPTIALDDALLLDPDVPPRQVIHQMEKMLESTQQVPEAR